MPARLGGNDYVSATRKVVGLLFASLPLLSSPGSAQPLHETGVLTVSDPFLGDRVGFFAARHRDILLLSSQFDDIACADVGCDSGSVYVFRRSPTGEPPWAELRKLTPADPRRGAYFGSPIAFDGETAAIGAYGDHAAGDVFPKGAAYIFERNLGGQDRWGQRRKLVPPDSTPIGFGSALALQGDTLVVTAPADAYACPAEPQFCVAGSAYVFERHRGGQNAWGLVKKVIPPDGMGQQAFGTSVALQGDSLFVAAPVARFPETLPIDAGVIYMFRRNEGGPDNWGFVQRLLPSIAPVNNGGALGYYPQAFALLGNVLAVGATADSRGCDAPVHFCGAVHLFSRSAEGVWSESNIILPPEPRHSGNFGLSVALYGEDLLLVGADGPPERVFAFARNQGGPDAWGLIGTLVPSDVPEGSDIGFSPSILAGADGFGAVGAVFSNRACPSELPVCDAGAIYLYDLAPLLAGPCVESPTTLCLLDGRFRVEVFFETAQGQRGTGRVGGHLSDESGHFWFFRESNPELFVKVVDACAPPFGRFWFFAAGLTNVRVEIRVTDTTNGEMRFYERPLGPAFLPIQDTNAFATCP